MSREKHNIHPIDLATAVTDQRVQISGSLLCFWHSGNASDVIQVRFDSSDAPLTPMMRGDRIERDFSEIYITVAGSGSGLGYLLYGDKTEIQVRKGADVSGSMADVVAELGDLETDVEAIGSAVEIASAGGDEVVSIATTGNGQGANAACRSVTFWTTDADIHVAIGTAAGAGDPKLSANMPVTLAIDNTNLLYFYNAGGTTETVNLLRVT